MDSSVDWDMLTYYTMPRLQDLLRNCWENGINTFQSRGDRHQMRMYLEHHQTGGNIQWIAQTASEFADIRANINAIIRYGAMGIYNHGTHTDDCWHRGKIEEVHDIIKFMKDKGIPAGLGSHIPEVIDYAETHNWETDFYMCCFYNLARGYKAAPAVDQNAYAKDHFPEEDPPRMTAVMRRVSKPCLGFKILAAGRKCASREDLEKSFRFAFDNIKPTDAVVVGMFQKYKDQAAENASIVSKILS